jgi:hypothetical protein
VAGASSSGGFSSFVVRSFLRTSAWRSRPRGQLTQVALPVFRHNRPPPVARDIEHPYEALLRGLMVGWVRLTVADPCDHDAVLLAPPLVDLTTGRRLLGKFSLAHSATRPATPPPLRACKRRATRSGAGSPPDLGSAHLPGSRCGRDDCVGPQAPPSPSPRAPDPHAAKQPGARAD